MRAIVQEDPAPLRSVCADAPPHFVAIVERLLRKDPEARYASAAAVLADLAQVNPDHDERVESESSRSLPRGRAVRLSGIAALLVAIVALIYWFGQRGDASRFGASASVMGEPSIAVLPLANADSVDAPLAAGMTEDLIATLARAGGVRVIASTSTAAFKNRKMDVRQIADSLGVSNILEGGIQRSGSQLRVEVRLIAARDGSTLWSQAYDREFNDMFFVHWMTSSAR